MFDNGAGRDGIANAFEAACAALDCSGEPDDCTRAINQYSTGTAGIQDRIDLYHARESGRIGRKLAIGCADCADLF